MGLILLINLMKMDIKNTHILVIFCLFLASAKGYSLGKNTCDLNELSGEWELIDSDSYNFDKFMKAIGVAWHKRYVAKSASRTLEFSVESANKVFKVKSSSKNILIPDTIYTATLDKSWEGETSDGKRAKMVFECENSILTKRELRLDSNDNVVMKTVHRWYNNNGFLEIKLSVEKNGVFKYTTTQKYKKVE